jgi:hypothetical protein
MATQNEGPLDISLDLTKKTTTVPMVADGHLCRWRLVNISKATGEKGDAIKFEYDLTAPAPNTEGGQIEPGKMGAKFFENITLYDKNTPKGTVPDWAEKRIAQRMDALLGTGDVGNKKGKPERPVFDATAASQMIGKEIVAKMKVGTDNNNNPQSNFGQVYFPGDIAA